VAPIDVDTVVESVSRTHRLVVVDEDTPGCSVGHEVAARVADAGFDYLDAPVKTLHSADVPVPYSAALESLYTPNTDQVVATVRELLGNGA
jgi:pyruvate dehydrogenase E1 component beta subunit